MNHPKSLIIDKLYDSFIQKAKEFHKNIFSSHVDFTLQFEIDSTKDSFGRLFKDDIEAATKIINPLNHRTLINMLKTKFTGNTHKNTLNTVSQYLGFIDFDDYAFQFNQKNNSIKEMEHVHKKSIPKNILISLIILPILITACYFSIYFYQKSSVSKVIFEANNIQFEAFKKLPIIYDSKLEAVFVKNGNAYKVVKNILNKHALNKRTIGQPNDNPSYYSIQEFLSFKFNWNFSEVKVYTKEHWYLKWFNLDKNDYQLKYDVSNEQYYLLKKINGKWFILDNDYEGDSIKIE